jgi:hypothetical protein
MQKGKACETEAKKKEFEVEMKMSPLQSQLRRIIKAMIYEHKWEKYWNELKEWGQIEGFLALFVAKIKSYLNTPILESFENNKEKAAKFLVSYYHDGKFWLDEPIKITPKLINFVTRFPIKGNPVPFGTKSMDLVNKFTGSNRKGKKSKILQINSIEMMTIKWTTLIVSIFLIASGRPLGIKIDMLEAIENIVYHTKIYNWDSHIVELLKSNCEGFQELNTPICFPSFLIWIAMKKISLVG